MPRLELSPPAPRPIEPSSFIGFHVLPNRSTPSGRAPSYQVERAPDCALPPFRAKVFTPLFFSTAVTNFEALPWLGVHTAVLPWNTPSSRSACTQGPCPVAPLAPRVERFSVSMCPAPVSTVSVSTLPKSEQQALLTFVPLATSYIDSGLAPRAVPMVTVLERR